MKKFLLVAFVGMVLVLNIFGLVKEVIHDDVDENMTVLYVG